MHVVLPELDGRCSRCVSLASVRPFDDLSFTAMINQPEPDRIDAVAERVSALVGWADRAKSGASRADAGLSGRAGRTGYAVGLDVPASVNALLATWPGGLRHRRCAAESKSLLEALDRPATMRDDGRCLSRSAGAITLKVGEQVDAAGARRSRFDVFDGAFRFWPGLRHVIVALHPIGGATAGARTITIALPRACTACLLVYGFGMANVMRSSTWARTAPGMLPGKAVA